MSRLPMIAALGAALMLGACSYSAESNVLGYRSSTSFSTPGAGPPAGYYAQPPAYSAPPAGPAYTEAPPAYPPPGYYAPAYAPPVYVAPSVGIAIGPRWGWGRWGRWRR